MLQSIHQLYGDRLGASDGEIGHVKDFYFDDRKWAVRYLVVDTGSWLPGRQILLSPHSFGRLDTAGKILRVDLTRAQIEGSPSIDTHKPVSRQHEDEFHRHYGLPGYWLGDALWGMSGYPVLDPPTKLLRSPKSKITAPQAERAEAHLRSTKAVTGYHVQASDGMSGQVSDFLIDGHSWAILQLVVRIGHRLSGREVQIPTGMVDRISYDESTVHVKLTMEAVEQSPAYPLVVSRPAA